MSASLQRPSESRRGLRRTRARGLLAALLLALSCEPPVDDGAVLEVVDSLPPRAPIETMEPGVRAQFSEKHALLDRALNRDEIDPEDAAWALGQLGRLYQAYRFTEAADRFYRAAIELDPTTFEWAYLAGQLQLLVGGADDTRDLLLRAYELKPEEPVVLTALGDLERKEGNLQEARLWYDRALERNSDLALAGYGLAIVDLAEGHAADAVESLRRLLDRQPEAFQLHHAMAQALTKLGRSGEAEHHRRVVSSDALQRVTLRSRDPWLESLQELPVSSKALEKRGRQALLAGAPRTAIQLFRQAEEIDPDQREIRFNLAAAYAQAGLDEEARAQVEKTLADFPDAEMAHRLKGRLLARAGLAVAARRSFARAVELRPESELTQREWADFLLSQGEVAQAARVYRRALDIDARSAASHAGLVRCELYRGDVRGAARSARAGLEQAPGSTPLRWLALRTRSEMPNEFSPPGEPVTVFELESLAMFEAAREGFAAATRLQRTALDRRGEQLHRTTMERRLASYERGEVPDRYWVAGERLTAGRAGVRTPPR
ncbi:MAG: tetratricopeptide repeat protein [Acidobacteriota bacterium]